MKANKAILQLADELGAAVDVWADSDNSYTIEVLAPDGMEWIESGAPSLISRFFTLWPETKAEAMNDIYNRMKQGIQDETI